MGHQRLPGESWPTPRNNGVARRGPALRDAGPGMRTRHRRGGAQSLALVPQSPPLERCSPPLRSWQARATRHSPSDVHHARLHPYLIFRAAVSRFSGFSLVKTKEYSHSKCSEAWHVPDSGMKQVLTFRVSRPAIEWLRALPLPRVLTAASKCLDGGAAQTRPGLHSDHAVARDLAISDVARTPPRTRDTRRQVHPLGKRAALQQRRPNWKP